ncbi:hypothetical protein V498_06374 [Pseudogymnoascus sp. VKM F-4517 (FW-2822)]|nr:hypothetical protein V498_06374 [Pseudogymnoascus sp. VKM F-4517 (FW-2822)]
MTDKSAQPITNGQPAEPPASTKVVSQQSVPLQGGNLDFDSSLDLEDVFGDPGEPSNDYIEFMLEDSDMDNDDKLFFGQLQH